MVHCELLWTKRTKSCIINISFSLCAVVFFYGIRNSLRETNKQLRADSSEEWKSQAETLKLEVHKLAEENERLADDRGIHQVLVEGGHQTNLIIADNMMGEVESLVTENAKLGGHVNHKQKIKIHSRLKEENNTLKYEVQGESILSDDYNILFHTKIIALKEALVERDFQFLSLQRSAKSKVEEQTTADKENITNNSINKAASRRQPLSSIVPSTPLRSSILSTSSRSSIATRPPPSTPSSSSLSRSVQTPFRH